MKGRKSRRRRDLHRKHTRESQAEMSREKKVSAFALELAEHNRGVLFNAPRVNILKLDDGTTYKLKKHRKNQGGMQIRTGITLEIVDSNHNRYSEYFKHTRGRRKPNTQKESDRGRELWEEIIPEDVESIALSATFSPTRFLESQHPEIIIPE